MMISKSKSLAKIRQEEKLEFELIAHKSLLLRPLKGVDMQYQHNKIKNLSLAIACIDGLVIAPGETFSLWHLVGSPSKRKGYLKGLVLSEGKIQYGYGGGLCQLGNLIYWMALHSPLKIEERWRHGYDVFPDINRKLPFGSGATLAYNYIDLQIKNESKESFQLNFEIDKTHLKGEIRCSGKPQYTYEVFETDHLINHQYWGGYTRHNKIWKRVLDQNGNLDSEELVTENHAIMMYEPLLSSNQ